MNWNQKYIEKHKENTGWHFQHTVNYRIQRFKANPPIKKEHFLELEYLIINYDYTKSLLKRYEGIISEETKTKWLEKNLSLKYTNYNIYRILLPFYLINPETANPKIDKHFLNDQLMLILGGLDNKFRKYRWRAKTLFEFLSPNFGKLKPNLRIRIIELISSKTDTENIRVIRNLVLRNQRNIPPQIVNNFIEEQFNRNLITPSMAVGIFRKVNSLNDNNIENLKSSILNMDNGEYILKKINPAPNNAYNGK
jgi:hypothetical protein